MKEESRAYLILHFCVFLWGFTAILGKLITLPAFDLVWYRMMFVSISFPLLPGFFKRIRNVDRGSLVQMMFIGFIVSLHWVCFYGSIKYSNVSIALSMLATTSFMTSLIEPILVRSRFRWHETALGLGVIPGVYLIFHASQLEFRDGIILGLLSAAFAALFTTLNKKYIVHIKPVAGTFVELSTGFLFMTALIPVYMAVSGEPVHLIQGMDIWYMIILSIACTTVPFILSLHALKFLSAFTSNLTVNLEPVYGIILALIIFRENRDMDALFFVGAAIILLAVFLHPLLSRYSKQ